MARPSRAGRPLRFLALTLGGWTAMRVVILWPMGAAVSPLPPPGAARAMAIGPASPLAAGMVRATIPAPGPRNQPVFIVPTQRSHPPAVAAGHLSAGTVAIALAAMVRYGDAIAAMQGPGGALTPPLGPLARGRSRLAGSAWLIARSGAGSVGNGTLTGGQLGASQAGARLTYALGGARRIALSARIAAPLHGRGVEAGLGVDWQPTRLPLHLLAEQRVSLDGGRGGPALLVVGGIDPTPVLAGFRLEGYAQAGAIKRSGDSVEAFGDGAARVTHRLAVVGTATLDLGAGAWGAAQRGTRRLDVGPTAGAVVPVGRRALRVTLDWRERVAGGARPGSGPALSIGTDF